VEHVEAVLNSALVSAVNWAEVVNISLHEQADVSTMEENLRAVGLSIEPLTAAQAETIAVLQVKVARGCLTMADCASVALALERKLPVLTADRSWRELNIGVEIRCIRRL
jgi:PIN domain nuclease of toxin-antitoxin system